MKILYVCPFAHLTGHPPFECAKETRILKEHGNEVELLTFCGVHEGYKVHVKENRVMQDNKLFKLMRRGFVSQWILKMIEYILTILKAMIVAGNRPIYLRDAEPIPHVVHILDLIFNKRWVISTTGGLYTTSEGISWIYRLALKFTGYSLNSFYKIKKDNIKYSAQNTMVKSFMTPLLGDNITVIPLGHSEKSKMDKSKARRELGIPDDGRLILMVMGINHSGKDSDIVFHAVQEMNNIFLIHAGAGSKMSSIQPIELSEKYNVDGKVLIIDKQIGDEEKVLLFGATDWLVLSYRKTFSSTTSMLWESMAYDVPVIASSGNELERLVRYWNVGLVFETGDVKDLEVKIDMARSQDMLEATKNNRKDFLDYFSEDKWYERTMALLDDKSSS